MLGTVKNAIFRYGDYISIVMVYFVVYGIILFNGAALYDSTVHVNLSRSDLIKYFSEWGNPPIAYLMDFLMGFKNLYLFKYITFASYLASALLLIPVLRTVREIDPASRLAIVMLFVALPYNDARVSVGHVLHSIAYVLFYFGYFFAVEFAQKRTLLLRISALVFLFFSFFINSFLVLYAIIIVHLAYLEKLKVRYNDARKFVARNADFFALPIVFWAVKKTYFIPYGYFATYNELKLSARTLYNVANTSNEAFIKMFDFLVHSFFLNSPGIVLLSAALLYFFFVKYSEYSEAQHDAGKDGIFFGIGIATYLLGVLPYSIVGVVGRFYYFESDFYIGNEETRHMCLIPLGMALTIYYGVNLLLSFSGFGKLRQRLVVFALLIALVANSAVVIYFDYQAQWLYYISLRTNFQKNELFRDNTTFLVNDGALKFLKFTTGTYLAALLDAFGDQSRFMITETGLMKESLSYENYSTNVPANLFIKEVPRDLTKSKLKKLRIEPRFMDEKYKGFYLLADYKPSNFQYEVVICPNPGFALTPRKVLKLTYYEKFKKYEFEKYITDLLSFEFKKIM